MRHVLVVAIVSLAGVASASAQVDERLEISGIVRSDRVSFEGRQKARLTVTGAAVSYRLWKDMRIEAEVTTASGESRRSYEGDFISYAGPEATRAEIERMAVIARRTATNKAGLGFATAVAVESLACRSGSSVNSRWCQRCDGCGAAPPKLATTTTKGPSARVSPGSSSREISYADLERT